MEQTLNPSDNNTFYSFYTDPSHNIAVQFSWNTEQNIIEEGTFHVIQSQNHIKLKAATTCASTTDDTSNDTILEIHAEYVGPTGKNEVFTLPIEHLNLSEGQKIRFKFLRYIEGETYNSNFSCENYTDYIPDSVPGGVVKKPSN